jgi:hypothetical protein
MKATVHQKRDSKPRIYLHGYKDNNKIGKIICKDGKRRNITIHVTDTDDDDDDATSFLQ